MGSSIQSSGPALTGNDGGDSSSQQTRLKLRPTPSEPVERIGLSEKAGADSEQTLEVRIEIARLKEMLSEQEQATLRALGSARDFQNQLKDALGEAARLQTQLKVALAAADTARVSPPDSHYAQSQFLRVQKDLQRERAGRESEAEQSADKILKLEAALADAIHEGTRRRTSGPAAKTWLGIGSAAMIAGILAGTGMFWLLRHGGGAVGARESDSDGVADVAPVYRQDSSAPVRRSANWSPSKETPGAKAQPEFTRSIDRLTRALGAFPGQDPQAVLLQVALKRSTSGKKVCSFDWKDGQPALVFDKGKSGSYSLSSAITECAEAVEQFR